MKYICIGKIITTHGIKGEIKIKSDFKYKDQVFIKGFDLYIGNNYEKHEILSYRKHQVYDMVTLDGINDIDIAIKYKKRLVYVLKSDLLLEEDTYLNEDLIGLNAYYNDKKIGIIKEITDQGSNNFVIKLDTNIYIPYHNNFLAEINLEKKEIHFKNLEGLL